MQPKNKRERKRENYRNIGHTGKLPWTARGVDECMRHIHERRLALKREDRKDWDPHVEALIFCHRKYGKAKGSPHFLRMGAITSFLTHYDDRLRNDDFIRTDERGRDFLDGNLMEAFARLPFTMAAFDYEAVKKYVVSCGKPS